MQGSDDETSLSPKLIDSLSLSEQRVLGCFCVLSLIPVSLLLRFPLLAQTKTAFPTNAATALKGQASGC